MLDFAAMNRSVGFNHKNQWFFRTSEHDFMFAFNDIVFDRNGFLTKDPIAARQVIPKRPVPSLSLSNLHTFRRGSVEGTMKATVATLTSGFVPEGDDLISI